MLLLAVDTLIVARAPSPRLAAPLAIRPLNPLPQGAVDCRNSFQRVPLTGEADVDAVIRRDRIETEWSEAMMRTSACAVRFVLAWMTAATASLAVAEDWPQWRGPTRDGVWRETGLMTKFPAATLPAKWSMPIGSGYSGPTVAAGRVFVTDRLVEPKQVERVHCFDEATGKSIWSHSYDCEYKGIGYDAGPRASVTIDRGVAYALGAMGHFFAFAADSGQILWQHDLNAEYAIRMPIWGIAASPLVYENLVIVHIGGSNGACLVAFDVKTGKEAWRALEDAASYSAPILIEQGGQKVLACWTGDSIAGLNPKSGEVYWRIAFPPSRMVIGISTPVVERDRLFVTSFYDGSMMVRLAQDRPAAEKLWHRVGRDEKQTDALQSIIATPYFSGDFVYGVDSYGELRCLKAESGDRVWESLAATPKARWSNIHMVQNGDQTWMFNERGELLITQISPQGYTEISRTKIIEPTQVQLRQRGGVCWSHPAFANRTVFARNDDKLIAVSVAAE